MKLLIPLLFVLTCTNPTQPDVYGCTHAQACNYNPEATIYESESCTFQSDCLGVCGGLAELDECGICQGEGADDNEVALWGTCYNISTTIEIHLDGKSISGSIPAGIGNLVNLLSLSLNSNYLGGQIPPEIGNLIALTNLSLSNNNLSGSIPTEIGNLLNLQILSLSNNNLSGSMPTEIGNLVNLIDLNLSNNQLSGEIPTEIGNLEHLLFLSLQVNELSGNLPFSIRNLVNVNTLSLNNNKLTGVIPSFNELIILQFLYLNDNHFQWIDFDVCNLDIEWTLDDESVNSKIYNNKLCPTLLYTDYPICIQDYLGYQNTSECD